MNTKGTSPEVPFFSEKVSCVGCIGKCIASLSGSVPAVATGADRIGCL